ncbi:hypothetical protein [Luteimonas qiangzhengi]|uniref:hypothetical protein n=1 Tax=Luteimonas sp. MJ146 TaxID=3129240 RepID=UPI0031BBADF3
MDDQPKGSQWPRTAGPVQRVAGWRLALALLCSLALPVCAADPADPLEGWRAELLQEKGLPRALRGEVLIQDGTRSQVAHIAIRAPFSHVQPAVEQALAGVGRFDGDFSQSPRAYMGDGWGEVLMSRHPDLRHAYARIAWLEGLQAQVDMGALLPWELEREMRRAEASADSSPQTRVKLPELQPDSQFWRATRTRRHGLAGRSRRVDVVSVREMDVVLGAPATVVSVHAQLRWPNPDGGLIDQIREFNILSPGPSRFLERQVVPSDLLTPVYEALRALPEGAHTQVHASPEAWVVPIEPPFPVMRSLLAAPAADARQLDTVSWPLAEGIGELRDLFPLPEGDLLLATHERGQPRLWHYRPGGDARLLWRNDDPSVRNTRARLVAGEQAGRIYLMLSDVVVIYDPATGATTHHPLQIPESIKEPYYWRWRRGPDGGLELYSHVYNVAGPLRSGLQRLTSGPVPVTDGEPWRFTPAFVSPRQAIANRYRRGNTQLKPIDALDHEGFWVEEPTGLALLHREDGRIVRAIELPLRLGDVVVGDSDATGMAGHVPEPFGSPAGRWIATGFTIGPEPQRGMHVTNVDTGRTLLSAWLEGVNSLAAGSASPDGTRIALGGDVLRSGSRIAIWPTASGRKAVVADVTPRDCYDLERLVWSGDGARLWGVCRNAVLSWAVD